MFDLELSNCRIFGNDESLDTIGMRDGRIVEIGKERGRARKSIDLEGKWVLPGFIDSHTHLLNLGLSMVRLDLSAAMSRDEALSMLDHYATESRAPVIIGYGWDETQWGERDYLNAGELGLPEKPVILFRKDMHMAVVNSRTMETIGRQFRDGVMKEEDVRMLDSLTTPGDQEISSALLSASGMALSEGITTVRDIMDARTRRIADAHGLPIRVFQTLYGRDFKGQPHSGPMAWGIKTFLDGSIGSGSAAHEGWEQSNLKYGNDGLQAFLRNMWNSGLQVAMHAIGEAAVHQAVSALESQKGHLRNSIEHFELVPEEDLDRISSSTVVSSQPNFLQWAMKGGLYESRLGSDWFGRDNPFREILDRGLHLAFGSDCMPMGPNYGIGLAVNSPHHGQRITMEEAVKAYTEGGAYVLHEEDLSGRIATGYRADLAVFDSGYMGDTQGVGKKKALMSIVGGQVKYEAQP